MNHSAPILSDYQIAEKIYEGSRTRVYRGFRKSHDGADPTGRTSVILKVLRHEYPSFNELVQFHNQYAIMRRIADANARNLNLSGIVKPLALHTYGNGYILVMPDEGYISLQQWEKKKKRLGRSQSKGRVAIAEFLHVAIQLAEILHGLYQNRVIHKDIKPDNIIIHPETQHVKLIDFSIASLLPQERQEIQNPNVLEGTLAYISPEQTGRMNRGIDYRTDFYSLGVTCYELLSGELPFQSDDPMELVHAHIAQSPPTFRNSQSIPSALSAIVMKLMSKNAEDRYQSALGLKHDLQQCLAQWENRGTIEPFELGERDRCDRFLIPEKLYGREHEVAKLLVAFDRVASPQENRVANGQTAMMLVAGYSGVGKTAVINEVHKPIVRQRGYFIKGKFDQFNRNIPFSAFVQAFRDLMEQLLSESDAQLQQWQSKILHALGDNAQVIVEVIPELERIIGKQPPVSPLAGTAAQNRFNLLFARFIQVFATPDHPLVIFLDDLQWSDSASLNLLKLLMGETSCQYLLLLGAYRDNEVSSAHPLVLTLKEISKTGALLNTITLQPLSQRNLNHLVAQTLVCSLQLALPLTELVYRKTKGNPFFATQFLKGLHEDGEITFNLDAGYWQCNMTRVRQLSLTEDVVEYMASRLHKLSEEAQEVLKLAACIGNLFDLATLAMASNQSKENIAASLWPVLREGLILPIAQTYKFFQGNDEHQPELLPDILANYQFLHDRVQQAAYSLIPPEGQAAAHLSIGQLLLAQTPVDRREEKIFTFVNQLNRGIQLLDDPFEKIELAQWNLKAGCKAKASVAYSAAVEYFQTGIELLGRDRWHDNPNLTLELYNAGTEAAYLNSNYTLMEQWLEEIFHRVPHLLPRIRAYEVKIQAQIAQNQLQDSVSTGLGVLSRLGVQLPFAPTADDIEAGFAATAACLEGKTPADLLALADMTAAPQLAALKMLAGIWGAAFAIAPPLMPLIVLEMVNLSVRHGNAPISAFAYVLYGVLLCGSENFQAGRKFGELSVQLLNRFNSQAFKAKILFLIGTHITIWQEPVRAALPTLQAAYQAGLETGDLEFAALPAAIYSYYSYLAGQPLAEVKQDFVAYTQAVERIKQTYYLNFLQIWHQAIANLLEESDNPSRLTGEICNTEELLADCERDNATTPMAYIYINRLMLNYLFGNYAGAMEISPLANEYAQRVPATLLIPIANFYESLSQLAFCCQLPEAERQSYLDAVSANQDKMQQWSQCAPSNYLHKFHLVKAEQHRALDEKLEAMEMYDLAISGAKENEYLQEEALANERAGQFYLTWGKEQIATGYIQAAYYCYSHWGSLAKVQELEKTYPQLLAPILQGEKYFDFSTTTTQLPIQSFTPSGGTTISSSLDLIAVLKASQAISADIQLDRLLSTLMQVAIENAGADKGALILLESGNWVVWAIATLGDRAIEMSAFLSCPLVENREIPTTLINYVSHTEKTLVINDVMADTAFAGDTYFATQPPQAVMGLPILRQGRAVGILYLENQKAKGAFTRDRLEVLNLLTSQAAISLENAQLYQQAQQALGDLQNAQLQLVQNEKMATLGNLVAGVAHEINNPLSFISGNVGAAKDYIADLFEILQGYQAELPNPSPQLAELLEDLDLDFIEEDLPKLIRSMQLGVDRIGNISTSLRTFSRADSTEKALFNLHDGIDSTLLILKYRLKASEQHPAIEIVKDYGELPEVKCFPGQLNQVFMNILANAIDAFEEFNIGRSYPEIEANPNRIIIHTEREEGNSGVIVRIADNGAGMSKEIQQQIFEHLFTTKEVGKGTGLGLSIARQIVEEKHGGTLTCTSELGRGTEFAIALPLSD